MGTFGLSADDIADIFEMLNFESHCEGDFSEKQFIDGARKYLEYLRSIGADIPKGEDDK